ncbi:MAG: hypothetical protein QXY52_00160 [Conexivisphaerales archaeon]
MFGCGIAQRRDDRIENYAPVYGTIYSTLIGNHAIIMSHTPSGTINATQNSEQHLYRQQKACINNANDT